jgi:hypothetical protein
MLIGRDASISNGQIESIGTGIIAGAESVNAMGTICTDLIVEARPSAVKPVAPAKCDTKLVTAAEVAVGDGHITRFRIIIRQTIIRMKRSPLSIRHWRLCFGPDENAVNLLSG